MRSLLLVAALTVAAFGCDSSFTPDGPFVTVCVDTEGAEVARAELSFQPSAQAESVGGSYMFTSGRLVDGVAESGGLRVTGSGPDVIVTFDSSVADGGAQLNGRVDGDAFDGTWFLGTIAGPVEAGTFTGTRAD